MGAAPLNWLAKIGGDTLKTKAKLLSSAINELYDDGQCKIVAVVDSTADNGKTVLITTDDNKTYSGTIANKKCEFLLPPKTLYIIQKVSSGSAEFTTKVEAGYGDCILVHLNTGYVVVKQGDIVGLDYIKAATDDNLKNKVPEAKAVKELNSSLTNVNVYVGEDEKLHFVDSTGADSVIPFSNVEKIPFTITLKKSTASSLTVCFSKEYDELPAVALELLTVDGSSGIYNGGVYPTLQIFNPIQLTNTCVTFNGLTETHASAPSRTYTGNVWVMGK